MAMNKRRGAALFLSLQVLAAAVLLSVSAARAQSVESLMDSGNEMLQRGAFDQAVTQFRKVLSREPHNFEAQYNVAFAYLGWGRYSNAVDEFNKALRMQPGHSQAWANLAVAYENQGKPNDAIAALSKAVKADPNNVTARVNLASMYANNNKLNQAINEYAALVKSGYTQPEVLVNYAKCLVTANRIDEAKNYFIAAVADDPGNVEAHWELADIYRKKEKNPVRAKDELRLAINAHPDVPMLYEGLADILEEEGDRKGAVEQLNKAIVYTSDVLVKERIRTRIDRLEGKGAGTGGGSAAASSPGQMQTLKREDENAAPTRTVKTKPVKVDFGSLLEEDNSDPMDVMPTGKPPAKQTGKQPAKKK